MRIRRSLSRGRGRRYRTAGMRTTNIVEPGEEILEVDNYRQELLSDHKLRLKGSRRSCRTRQEDQEDQSQI